MKSGLHLYEEIQKLAFDLYGRDVTVQSLIFGDGYTIEISGQMLHEGTALDVFGELVLKLSERVAA